jgi:hypothetical protein
VGAEPPPQPPPLAGPAVPSSLSEAQLALHPVPIANAAMHCRVCAAPGASAGPLAMHQIAMRRVIRADGARIRWCDRRRESILIDDANIQEADGQEEAEGSDGSMGIRCACLLTPRTLARTLHDRMTGSNARARVDLLALVICFATTVAASVATTVAASAVPFACACSLAGGIGQRAAPNHPNEPVLDMTDVDGDPGGSPSSEAAGTQPRGGWGSRARVSICSQVRRPALLLYNRDVQIGARHLGASCVPQKTPPV